MFRTIFIIATTLALAACSAPAATPTLAPTVQIPTAILSTATPAVIPTRSTVEPSSTAVTSGASTTLDATLIDSFTQLAIDYPSAWKVIDVSDEVKQQSAAYTISFRSAIVTPSNKGAPVPGLAGVDFTVIVSGANSLEQGAAMLKQNWKSQDPVQEVTSQEEISIQGGLKGYRWQVASGNSQTTVYITVLKGNTILLSGVGDPDLLNRMVQTLRPSG